MLNNGKSCESARPGNFWIRRNGSPAQTLQTAFLGLCFDRSARSRFLTRRQKDHSKSEFRRQIDARVTRLFADQFFRDASEQTSAVTASAVGVYAAAMDQPHQSLEGAVDDLS